MAALPKNVAAIHRKKPGNCFEQGRLAGAVRPDDAQHLAAANVKRDLGERELLAVALGQRHDLDQSWSV